MLSFLWSTLVSLVAVPLRGLVRLWRRGQLGRRGVLELVFAHDMPGRPSLDTLVGTMALLRAMKDDDLLRAVVLRIRSPALGQAAAQEVHGALTALREAGKLVMVHLEHAGNQELLLASAADRVFLSPAAEVMMTGVGAQLVFYGEALDRLGVVADMEAAGAYKSFGEPMTRSYPSPANREAVRAMVDDLADQLLQTIARSRRMSVATLQGLVDRSPVSAEEALDAGLIDALGYADQAHTELEALLDQPVEPLSFRKYARWLGLEKALSLWGRRDPGIAVVHLEGPVVHGAEPSGGSGLRIDADRVVPVLDELREQDQMRAVVLYVDSPGGSALASDIIARAVKRLGERKPVVTVMGDVAASGGYYIAAPTAEIVAAPGTITGSIGVVGGKIVFGPGAARFGVHMESVASSESSSMFSPWRRFRDEERARFREMLARTYQRFLQIVSAGRRRPVEAVEPFAQGRVWTGRQALAHGLVDHLGGLELGVERARQLAGLQHDPPVFHLRFPPPRFRFLAELLGRGSRARSPDLVELGLASLGETGQRLSLLRASPGLALTLLDWEIRA